MEFHGELAGLLVTCVGMSGESWVAFASLGVPHAELVDNPTAAVPLFMQHVDSWNLRYGDGRCVPVTLEAFMRFDMRFIKAVASTWLREVVTAEYPATTTVVTAAAPTMRGPTAAGIESWADPLVQVDPELDMSDYYTFQRPAPVAA